MSEQKQYTYAEAVAIAKTTPGKKVRASSHHKGWWIISTVAGQLVTLDPFNGREYPFAATEAERADVWFAE